MSCQSPRDAKEHDSCLVQQFNATFLQPLASALPQVTPGRACELIAQGDALEQQLFSQYKRAESKQNLSHTEVWPYWRGQLQQRCGQSSPMTQTANPQPQPSIFGPSSNGAPSLTASLQSALSDPTTLVVVALVVLLLLVRK